jgi:adenine-specific DNA-methyltransferase
MIYHSLSPNQSLNKAYRKEKVARKDIELFKSKLGEFLESINEKESEEHVKNNVTKFLYETYYQGKNQINTKGRIDLAIYEDKKPVVIIEAKRPNSPDMVSSKNLNAKAMHELMLYYLRERIEEGNNDIKFLVATNMYEWFVFDALVFEKLFYKHHSLTKDFNDWKNGRKSGDTTDFFYTDIAFKFLNSLKEEITFTKFDLREIEKVAANKSNTDDHKLIPVFKFLSPAHLLKQPFANDSNSLDTKFYSELLHIIGLEEKKDGGKKIIQRKEKPDPASLLENAIATLVSDDKLRKLPEGGKSFGATEDERLFNVGLELCITWINRVLFLKLLEGQLLIYHGGDKEYRFLDFKNQSNFDQLNKLFFDVLAKVSDKRPEAIRKKYAHVPYLNSSLFDFTPLEEDSILIKSLDDSLRLKLASNTVLKSEGGKKREGDMPTLQYLFEFLDAYDFASEGKEEIQEENKGLINASVLGLIFEKINGYKDGSFFTPGFITMYMCRETIRRAVVQKFNEAKGWKLESFDQLYNEIKDIKEANAIINSLKICDPAVGSGHFLVSALNEIIAIKSELNILSDRSGKVLRGYSVEVINDELIISIDHSEFFEYKPSNKESQRVQEALFHEKQTIIENCLFGVDINPNSVKICRLRLWIELLKNAYYTADSKYVELETLPNIDINIKQGNSLISRFSLDADLSKALKSIKYGIDDYRSFVNSYKNASDKEEKRGFEKLIAQIKSDFRTEISKYSDPDKKKLQGLTEEMFRKYQSGQLYDHKLSDKQKKDRRKLEADISKLKSKIQSKISDPIFSEAFEWRFEFPEVLDNEGNFFGFDAVIGNPPYIRQEEIKSQKPHLENNYKTYSGTADLYVFFVEKGFQILTNNGLFCFIMPNKWMQAGYGKSLRYFFTQNELQSIVDFGDLQLFEGATTYPCILSARKQKPRDVFYSASIKSLQYEHGFTKYVESVKNKISVSELSDDTWVISSGPDQRLLAKLNSSCLTLSQYVGGEACYGVKTGLTEAFLVTDEQRTDFIKYDKKALELLKPVVRGRNMHRWITERDNSWLIGTFPALKLNIDDYPSIKSHLLSFGRARLDQSGKTGSRKKTSNDWFETQDTIAYWGEFEKPKIMYQVFQVKPCFIYDEQGLYCNNSIWIIPKDDKALVAILNSRIGWWLISKYCTAIQNGFQLIWKYFGQIPIPKGTQENKKLIELVDEILKVKKKNPDSNTAALEKEIDQLVYELYELTEDEIKIVEGK